MKLAQSIISLLGSSVFAIPSLQLENGFVNKVANYHFPKEAPSYLEQLKAHDAELGNRFENFRTKSQLKRTLRQRMLRRYHGSN